MASLGVAVLLAAGCTCACSTPASGVDAAADSLRVDSSRDQGVDRRRDLLFVDAPEIDAAPLPACGGSRALAPVLVAPYAPTPCGAGCQQVSFGRRVELTYRVGGKYLVYPSLASVYFEVHAVDLETGKEWQLTQPAPLARNCKAVAVDGSAVVAACAAFAPTGGTISRYSFSRIDLTTFVETDLYCQDIPLADDPCLADMMGASDGIVGFAWYPGKCGRAPHTLPLNGGPLTKLASSGYHVAMSGKRITWTGFHNGYSAIMLHDRSTGLTKPASPAAGSQAWARIDGDQLVWVDTRNGSKNMVGSQGNHDIYHYNLLTQQETRINTDAAVQLQPDISGKWIVWEDWRNSPGGDPSVNDSNADIYAYNLETKQEIQLTNFPGRELSPHVDNGRVFYRRVDNKGNANIFMIDLAKRQLN